ncbi:unnamed protein product, partial [Hapterophycus canaliculatus]
LLPCSTGAGGTGVTLTGADRVILFDPSWNPADDMQAVDRAYRIGQKRDVIVYRMIAAGTVEEKMYEKQIFKDGLRRTIMGGTVKRKKNVRYFSRAELKQLFTLYPAGHCRVRDQLEEMHGPLSGRLEAAEPPAQQNISRGGHLDFVCSLRGAYGASAHGEGLPKIVQQEVAAPANSAGAADQCLGGGGSGVGGGNWVVRNFIDEEEDESDVEDSDGGGRRSRERGDALLYGLLHGEAGGRQAEKDVDELIAMELDLDGGAGLYGDGDDDGCGGDGTRGGGSRGGSGAAVSVPRRRTAVGREAGKRKGPSRSRFLSGIDSDTDEEDESVNIDDFLGGRRAGMDGRRTGGATGARVLDLSTAGTDEFTAIALDGESDDSDIEIDLGGSGGGGGGGSRNEREDVANEVVHLLDDDSNDDSEAGSLSPPHVSFGQSIAFNSDHADSSPSAMEEEEKVEGMVAVETGKERARRWASGELGIAPPGSPPNGGGGGDADVGGETTEDEEDKTAAALRRKREAAATAAEKRMAEARRKARAFATEELGMKNPGRGSWSSTSSPEKGRPDDRSAQNAKASGEEESGEASIGGFGSPDGSMDAGDQSEEEAGQGGRGAEGKVKAEEQRPLGQGRGSESPINEEYDSCISGSDAGDAGGSVCSPMTVDEDAYILPACAPPASPAAAATTGGGGGSAWSGSPGTATYSSPRSSISSPVDATVGDLGRDESCDASAVALVKRENYRDGGMAGERAGGSARARGSSEESDRNEDLPAKNGDHSISRSNVATPEKAPSGAAPKLRGDPFHDRGDGGKGAGLPGHGSEDTSPARSSYETADSVEQQQQQEEGREVVGSPRQSFGINENDAAAAAAAAASAGRGGYGDESDRGGSSASLFAPATATVCPAHATAAERAGFTCRRCSCSVGAEAAEQAKGLLFEAWAKEREGDTYSAMGVCLEAIKICDEDMELHKTIARIGSRMGCLS